jgi:hypothetical protein
VTAVDHSRGLWNRSHADLESDEILAQILDRGALAEWREIYARAAHDRRFRERVLAIVTRVALPYPAFWLAALANLGEPIDWTVVPPSDEQGT